MQRTLFNQMRQQSRPCRTVFFFKQCKLLFCLFSLQCQTDKSLLFLPALLLDWKLVSVMPISFAPRPLPVDAVLLSVFAILRHLLAQFQLFGESGDILSHGRSADYHQQDNHYRLVRGKRICRYAEFVKRRCQALDHICADDILTAGRSL